MDINELAARARLAAGQPVELAPAPFTGIGALLGDVVRHYRARPAFTCLGGTITYDELNRLSAAFASWLQHHTDLQPGDRIAIQMPNLLQYPVALFGALRAGLVVVNTNPLYTAREMEHQFVDSGARALVLFANIASHVQPVLAHTRIRHVIVTEAGDLHAAPKRWMLNLGARYLKRMVPAFDIPGAVGFRHALSLGAHATHREAVPAAGDLALLQYTGGTTGVSKGAMLSHGNILANVEQSRMLTGSYDFVAGREVLLLPMPLYHIYAFMLLLGMLRHGTHTVLIPDPRNRTSLIDAFRDLRPSAFAGLNTLFVALCEDARFAALDFSALRVTISGGMALTAKAATRWKEVTGCAIVEGYGMTEASPIISFNPVSGNRPGTIGIPVASTQVRVVDDRGGDVTIGMPGELLVRGPQVMSGYWQRPDETAQVLSADGWLVTGDIVVMTEEGHLKIVDRKKDMILISGFNVYPNEIEDVVVQHPGVLECAAIGVPDERTGEAIRLFVVRREKGLTEDELLAHCRERLTGYKMPRHITFRDSLPKSNVGKVLRRQLRDA
jgi:long-chain acyl-CoA synthetase